MEWAQTIPVVGPGEPARLGIGVRMREIPTDGSFAFAVPGYDAASTVIFPAEPVQRSPVYKPDLSVLVMVEWRGGFETSITIRWWQGATPPPAGASIAPLIAFPYEGGEQIMTFPNPTFDEPARPRPMRVEPPLVTRTF